MRFAHILHGSCLHKTSVYITQKSLILQFIPDTLPNLRHTTKSLRPASTEATHEVIRRISTKTVPAIRTDTLGLFLGLSDFLFELGGTGVDELELGELGVEDADDLCQLQSSQHFVAWKVWESTYRIIRLARLAERL
jgi:hypothetical protein